MLKKNIARKKFINFLIAIAFSFVVFGSFVNSSQTTAQSSPENTPRNEQSTPTDSPNLNQPPVNTDTSNEAIELSDDTDRSFFNPPPLGAPKRTADAGARTVVCPVASDRKQLLTLVIPNHNPVTVAAATISEYPTFIWYLPQYKNLKSVVLEVEEVLVDRDNIKSKLLYQQTIPVSSTTPGIMRFQVPESQPPLEIDKWYIWYLFLSSQELLQDNQQNQTNIQNCDWVKGIIGYRPLNSTEQAELNAANNHEKLWTFYSQEMIWYDALATLDKMRRDYPNNERIQRRWEAFLGLIGLGKLSDYPPL